MLYQGAFDRISRGDHWKFWEKKGREKGSQHKLCAPVRVPDKSSCVLFSWSTPWLSQGQSPFQKVYVLKVYVPFSFAWKVRVLRHIWPTFAHIWPTLRPTSDHWRKLIFWNNFREVWIVRKPLWNPNPHIPCSLTALHFTLLCSGICLSVASWIATKHSGQIILSHFKEFYITLLGQITKLIS